MSPTDFPGVYVEELPARARTIEGTATATTLFIGWAARGPLDRAVRIASFTEYERQFGGLDARTWLGYAVRQFFANGGTAAYVIRLACAAKTGRWTPAANATASCRDLSFTALSPGAWANGLQVRLTPRTDAAARFKVEVHPREGDASGSEVFADLSVSAADPRFVEGEINGRSTAITVSVGGGAPPPAATVTLAGGADGTVLDPNDPATRAAFDELALAQFAPDAPAARIDSFNLLCVPGESDPATLRALQGECARRRAFLIADCAPGAQVDGVASEADGLIGPDSRNAAFYFPWVHAPDPLQGGAARAFPPSGFVAGIYARTDNLRGVWKAPAGMEAGLRDATGLDVRLGDTESGWLNPHAVNCLRVLPGRGCVVWGARTLAGHALGGGEWQYVNVRRLALYVEESIARGIRWAVFEPSNEALWGAVRGTVGLFLHDLFRSGAFAGDSARDAYFVRCGSETMTQADVANGLLNIEVGFAPLRPAEFVVLRIKLHCRGPVGNGGPGRT